jgi:FkbM family methyltransferase
VNADVTRWSGIRIAVGRRYPLLPFRGRVPLLQGSVEEIPAGMIVETRPGIRVKVAPNGMYHDVYFWGDYEPYNTKIYHRLVGLRGTVFDVGANFGWYTTLFARWVGESGQVHAFEPVPFIHHLASETLHLNDLTSRVRLNQLALGRSSGTATIHTYAGLPHGHATIADLGRSDGVEHACQVTTLDEYCENNAIDAIQFMKVDVEGFEPDVFAGGKRILGSPDAPIIAFEVNGTCLRARSLRSVDVIDELRSAGYSHFFRFSTRTGIRRMDSENFEHGDCIAVKTMHLPRLERALKTSRVFH